MDVNNPAVYGGTIPITQAADADALLSPGPDEFFVSARSEKFVQEGGKTKSEHTTVFKNVNGDKILVSTSAPIAIANVKVVLVPKS